MKFPTELLGNNSNIREYLEDLHSHKNVSVFGLNLGERLMLAQQSDNFLCYVVADEKQAELATQALTSMGRKVATITQPSDDFTYHLMEFGDKGVKHQIALCDIALGRVDCCVLTADALGIKCPPREVLLYGYGTFAVDQRIDIEVLLKNLVSIGYNRVDVVDAEGQFAVRGDVVDIFAFNQQTPYRLHFFDDIIEKITMFNTLSQYSTTEVKSIEIYPNAYIYPEQDIQELRTILEQQYTKQKAKAPTMKNAHDYMLNIENIKSILDNLRDTISRSAFAYFSAFLPTVSILDYLPTDALVFVDQPRECHEVLKTHIQNVNDNIKCDIESGQLVPLHKNLVLSFDDIKTNLAQKQMVCFQSIMVQNRFFEPHTVRKFTTMPLPKLHDDYGAFAKSIEEFINNKYKIILCIGDGASLQEIVAKLQDYAKVNVITEIKQAVAGIISVMLDDMYLGACFIQDKILILGTSETKYARAKSHDWEKQMVKITDRMSLPEAGDYVVHVTHGIGICEGVKQLVINNSKRDYVVVSYKNNDKLYVPTDQLDLLGRYIGDKNPKLNSIGTNSFEKEKQKVRENVKELAFDLVALYKTRENSRGTVMQVDDRMMQEFEASFRYTPTPDQMSAFRDVYQDLASGKIMDRLVVGDVGFGKTEVAVRASFVSVLSGYQVAVIVPTTILAEQHYNTFCARLEAYGFVIKCLNRFKTSAQQKQIIQDTKDGKVDILIGTHRLLSEDVGFHDLGLLVLDEEQRFGVGDKEKLKNAKKNVHVLTLSATPIPRTLHMSLVGIRDISTIETPPLNRLPVQTVISQFSYSLLTSVCKREFARNGQVLIVYPRVENIDVFANSLKQYLGENIKIGVAHGRMDKKAIESTILSLYQGEIDVLVATTLIENGVDLPNANTLFVVSAELLGLSQLYQLKGRVGRSDKLAYAYFTYMDEGALSSSAYNRLSVLTQFTELGSGFKVAMRDLELRGAGNVLGAEQHGAMARVGYDLYCKLLDECVTEAKGEKITATKPVRIEIDIDAHIPSSFEDKSSQRMEIYSAISNIRNDDDATMVYGNIVDKYGRVPESISGLINVAKLKAKCQKANIERAIVTQNKVALYFANEDEKLKQILEQIAGKTWSKMEKNGNSILNLVLQNDKNNKIWDKTFEVLDKIIGKYI